MIRQFIVVSSLFVVGLSPSVMAKEPLSDAATARQSGARQLMSNQIAQTLVGKTVKARRGTKTFLFYYDDNNKVTAKLVGGKWTGAGFYGITDTDQVCVSMAKDKGRLRCLTLLRQGEKLTKYNVNGKLAFELVEVTAGKGW